MNDKKFEDFKDLVDCYFIQDYDVMYINKDDAIDEIILNFPINQLVILVNQIELIFKHTENEKNLDHFLNKELRICIAPETPGIDFETYTEILEYIRDKVFDHLLKQGMKPEEISPYYPFRKTIVEKINIYFRKKDKKIIREELLTDLGSSDYEKARIQITYLSQYFRDYKYNLYKNMTPEKRAELEYVLKDILDENGLMKECLNLYPKLINYQFLTSSTEHFQTKYRLEVIRELNFLLFTLKNLSNPNNKAKIKLAINNILKVDYYYSLEETEQNKFKELHAQVFFKRASIIHSFVTNYHLEEKYKHYYQRNTVFNIQFDCSNYSSCCLSFFTNSITSLIISKRGTNESIGKATFLLQQAIDASKSKDDIKFEECLDKAWEYHFELFSHK